MTKKQRVAKSKKKERNDALYDWWSLVHLVSGIGFAWTAPPLIALAVLVLWEPLENLVLSPLLDRFGITFGYESWRNSLSDIFFDIVGFFIGLYLFRPFLPPPFHLF